jgi:antitoxin (DNA-binding transcriptional repressor) of toxin-antitoxin stability system
LQAARTPAAQGFSYHRYGEVKARLTIEAGLRICPEHSDESGYQRRQVATSIDEEAPGSYLMAMRSVGLKVLKNKLSEYVRLASSGETVLVTDRDRVVAQLMPPQATPERQKLSEEEYLEKGVREGWIRPATNLSKEPPARHPMVPFDELMAELDRDREDRDLP